MKDKCAQLQKKGYTVYIDAMMPVDAILIESDKKIIVNNHYSLTRFLHDFYNFEFFKCVNT